MATLRHDVPTAPLVRKMQPSSMAKSLQTSSQPWSETAPNAGQEKAHQSDRADVPDLEYLPHHTYIQDQPPATALRASNHHMPVPSPAFRGNASYMITVPPPASLVSWLDSIVVTSITPSIASPGSQIAITLHSYIPPQISLPLYFFVGFKDTYSPGVLSKTAQNARYVEFMLSTQVPRLFQYSPTGPIALSMVIEDTTGARIMDRQIGQLTYTNITDTHLETTPFRSSGKRKASLDSPDCPDLINKRSRWNYMHDFDLPPTFAYGHPSPPSSNVKLEFCNKAGTHQNRVPFSSSRQAYLMPGYAGKQLSNYATTFFDDETHSTALTRSISAFEGHIPTTMQYAGSMAGCNRPVTNTRTAVSSSPTLGTYHFSAPRIRSSSDGALMNGVPPQPSHARGGSQNTRTTLALDGDLETMLRDWTEAELTLRRRLVVFERKQSGTTISASFKAVAPEKHTPGSICVSCIWWESRKTCFITSVDTIALAEQLCGYKFNVPVKNRIRRNMEGYKPITVAKDKEECEDFFRVIMGFTNPKPRNIEKHIKVFAWSCLTGALKKIVGKYGRGSSTTTGHGSTTRQKQAAAGSTTSIQAGYGEAFGGEALTQPFSPASGASSYELSMERTNSGKALSRATPSPAFYPAAMFPGEVDFGAYKPYQPRLEPSLGPLLPQLHHDDYYYWPQPQLADDNSYCIDETNDYNGWGFPPLFDASLTATPTSLQLNHQHHGTNMLGEMQTPGQLNMQTHTPELLQLQLPWAEEQPTTGGRTGSCFRGLSLSHSSPI